MHYEEVTGLDDEKILKIALTKDFKTTYDYVYKNKELFDQKIIIAFEETKEFIEVNSSILSNIPDDEKLEFLCKCINIKTDFNKNVIFYFLKK